MVFGHGGIQNIPTRVTLSVLGAFTAEFSNFSDRCTG